MRSWELRSAVSLGELLAREGRQSEMRDLLAPLLAGFGEEDERRDLVEARTLLAAS